MTAWRSANRCGSTYAARTYRRSAPSAVALTSERLTGLRAHGRIGPSLFTYALIATARSRLSSIGRIHSPRSLPMFDVLIKNALGDTRFYRHAHPLRRRTGGRPSAQGVGAPWRDHRDDRQLLDQHGAVQPGRLLGPVHPRRIGAA